MSLFFSSLWIYFIKFQRKKFSPSEVLLAVLEFELRSSHLARQVLYHLSHSSSPFYVGYFWDKVSGTVCPDWLWILISASQVPRITGEAHIAFFIKKIYFKDEKTLQPQFIMSLKTHSITEFPGVLSSTAYSPHFLTYFLHFNVYW
jgi:hypothetical protein